MAKFSGKVGFAEQVETRPGIWENQETEKMMRGDVLNLSLNSQTGENAHDDLSLNNRISLISDKETLEKFHTIIWVEYLGIKWKVTSVDVDRPRLILSLGGVWNG